MQAERGGKEQKAPRYRGLVVLSSAISLVAGGAIGYLTPRAHPSAPIEIYTPIPTNTPSPTATPSPICIHVAGAVRRPDVYELPSGSIVRDAIAAAGGASADADLNRINLALGLQDHQQIYIPYQGEANPPPAISGGGAAETMININTATAAELETLPRIGPTTAQRILTYREANGPFAAAEDIQNVPGIGPATFEGLEDLITIGP